MSDRKGLIVQGSGRVLTLRPNSQINLNSPGTVEIMSPGHVQEIESAGFIVTADGRLTGDMTLNVTVNRRINPLNGFRGAKSGNIPSQPSRRPTRLWESLPATLRRPLTTLTDPVFSACFRGPISPLVAPENQLR